MKNLELYTAEVIDIDDTKKKRGIKIKILPELKGVKDSDLPWAFPFICKQFSKEMENDLPEIGSMMHVLVDKLWKRFYYIGNRFFYDLFDFSLVTTALDKATELGNKDYKNIKFHLYPDGGLEFHNVVTGSHGFISKSGSYSIFDDSGNIIVNADSKNVIINGTAVEINGNTKNLVTHAELNTALSTFLTSLGLTLASGANGGGPVVFAVPLPASIDITLAKTNTIKVG